MWVYYFFVAILVWQSIESLRGGFRFLRYVRGELAREPSGFTPCVSIIAPCRGLDTGLRENLVALFEQDYPSYEIAFVADSADDPSLEVIEEVRDEFEDKHRSRVVIAGHATDSGQKVHNLRAACGEIDSASEVIVFTDTDARAPANWLRSLVAPLKDGSVGAATGYRWFIPGNGSFASHLRSVWNASIASALGADRRRNFCWGGATAIRREVFDRLKIRELWRGTLSDDFTVTRAMKDAGLSIYFVPQCLTPSIGDCSFSELIEFTNRQMKITRVYASNLWKAVIAGSTLFVLVFFGGFGIVALRASHGQSFTIPLGLLLVIFSLGFGKSWLRLRAVGLAMIPTQQLSNRYRLAQLVLWPFASLLYLYNAIAAGFSRTIVWREIEYKLISATKTEILEGTEKLSKAAVSNSQHTSGG
jgi:cellulose synthase/poly-beta-1,6-N-acetylglucosamine synthase-like glycosyltransferase